MGGIGIWHWLIVLVIALLVFGNRLPNVMGDLAKGIKNFKSGLKDEEAKGAEAPAPAARLNDATVAAAPAAPNKDEATRG